MENEILKEIRDLKAFQEKRFGEMDSKIDNVEKNLNERIDKIDERIDKIDERIDKIDEKIDNLDEKIDKVEREIINEYKSFVNTVDTVNKREIKKIENKVNENTDNLNAYKEKISKGIGLFAKAVG